MPVNAETGKRGKGLVSLDVANGGECALATI